MSASITAGESRDNGLQAIWNRLRANPKIPLLVAASAAIAIVVALLLWVKSPDYRVLYSNLNDRDGGAIVTQLTQMNIPYRFAENGAALLIPAERCMKPACAGAARAAERRRRRLRTAGSGKIRHQPVQRADQLSACPRGRAVAHYRIAGAGAKRPRSPALPKPSLFVREQNPLPRR